MIHSDFTAQAGGDPQSSARQAFYRHEAALRQDLVQSLDHVLGIRAAGSNSINFNYAASLHRLEQLRSALTGDGQKGEQFVFDYEQTLPVSAHHQKLAFHEALFRFQDRAGHRLSAPDILGAVDNAAFGTELGQKFRLWLIHAQMIDFYKNQTPDTRLSMNIYPQDTDHQDFRDRLKHGLDLAHAAGYGNIILEAVENAPWDGMRHQFMRALAKDGTATAIDDYGAPGGHNNLDILKLFNNGATSKNLIIKIDGTLIRNFLDHNDTALIDRLREIKAHAPQAVIVAEWINGAADANNLLTRLASYGLRDAIHLVQGRDLTDTAHDFVKKIGPAAGPALKK